MRQPEQGSRGKDFGRFVQGREQSPRNLKPAFAGAGAPFSEQNSQTVDNNPHIMQASQPGVIPGGMGGRTGVKERPTRTVEPEIKEPSIPQQDIEDANAGRLGGNKLIEFIKRHPAVSAGIGVGSVAVGGAVAAGINAELNNRTEAHQSITAPTTSEGPSTFDLNADNGIIGPENSIVATYETDPEAVAPKGMPEKGVGVLEKGNPAATISLTVFNEDGTVPVLEYEFTRTSHSMVDNNMLSITKGIKPGMIVASPIKGTIYHYEAGRFMRSDGLLGRPSYALEGIDENGRPIIVYIMTNSDVLPLIETSRGEEYNGKEIPKRMINIGDDIFKFVNVRNGDGLRNFQLSYATSGVGEIAVNIKDGKIVFASKPQPSTSQQNP